MDAKRLTKLILVLALILPPLLSGIATDARSSPTSQARGALLGSFPLEIREISLEDEPRVGRTVEIGVEVVSSVKESDVTIRFDLDHRPGAKIELVQGSLIWQGTVQPNQPVIHKATIRVTEAGTWPIHVAAVSDLGARGSYADRETIHLESSIDRGAFIRAADYEYRTSYEDGHTAEMVPERNDVDDSQSSTRGWLAQELPTVEISGRVTYDALEKDGAVERTLRDQPLGRALLMLWNRHPSGDRLLARTHTSADGSYTFEPVVNRGNLDLYLEVWGTDSERISVTNALGQTHRQQVNIGDQVPEGQFQFDANIGLPLGDITQAFYVFDLLANEAYGYLETQVGWGNDDLLKVRWPEPCVLIAEGPCFAAGGVWLPLDESMEPDIIFHEYGHFVLSRYLPLLDVVNACLSVGYKHTINLASSDTCAWSEGWANFFEMAVQDDPDYRGFDLDDVEDDLQTILDVDGDPEQYEFVVAAVLWDFLDTAGGSETFDEFADGFNGPSQDGIWHFSTSDVPQGSKPPRTIREFWQDAWSVERTEGACYGSVILQHHLLEYAPFTFTLERSVEPRRAGATIADPGPGCPKGTYEEDTEVTLQATPAAGYRFVRWELSPNGERDSAEITVAVTQDIQAKAVFELLPTPTATRQPEADLVLTVSQGVDDAGPDPGLGCTFSTSRNEIYFGECFDGQDIISGFRFRDLAVPRGATVESAFLRFTTNGPYDNGLTLRIFGESSVSPPSFSDSNRPADRPRTDNSVQWQIPASDHWGLGEERTTPGLESVVQEIVDQSDWRSGNSAVLLVLNDGPANGLHRRVIAFERPTTTYSGHLAELVVSYSLKGHTPTPPPGATPTSTPTATPTPEPTQPPPPPSCQCAVECLLGGSAAGRNQGSFGVLASLLNDWFGRIQQTDQLLETLREVRDLVMAETPEGQHYIDLYVQHSPEIVRVLSENDELREQGFATIELLLDELDALANGRGESVTIEPDEVQAVETFLDKLSEESPELATVIAKERQRRDLGELAGKSMAQAWASLNGYSLEFLPPLGSEDPVNVRAGRTVPVQFSLRDMNGNLVRDSGISLALVTFDGTPVLGPFEVARNPSSGLVYWDGRYHFNLPTKDLPPGAYLLEITFNSVEPGEPAQKAVVLVSK